MNHYKKTLAIAQKNGLTKKDVDLALLEVAGKYSNMTDNEIRNILQSEINAKCEPIYESQGASAFNECTQKLVDDYRLNELRNSNNPKFWSAANRFLSGFFTGLSNNTTGYGNVENFQDSQNNQKGNDEKNNTILGMKPLTFTLVSILTLGALTVGIVYLTKKK